VKTANASAMDKSILSGSSRSTTSMPMMVSFNAIGWTEGFYRENHVECLSCRRSEYRIIIQSGAMDLTVGWGMLHRYRKGTGMSMTGNGRGMMW